MGILADFFVATADDAQHYASLDAAGDLPAERFDRLQFGGLTNLEIEILWSLMDGKEWNADEHGLESLFLAEDGETWLFQFPELLVSKLAGLTSEDRSRLAGEWSVTEEMDVEASELLPVIEGLSSLAGIAKSRDRAMYLSGSM